MDNPVLTAARTKRASQQTKLEAVLTVPTTEERSLTTDEMAEFTKREANIKALDAQIAALEASEERIAASNAAAAEIASTETRTPVLGDQARVTSEPQTYSKYSDRSYMRDMATIAASTKDVSYLSAAAEAIKRMQRHGSEVEVEARHNAGLADALAGARAEVRHRSGLTETELRVTPSGNVAGQGGELVPPIWYIDGLAKFLRPGRVFADRVSHAPLPPGTNSLNWPKITLGALTGVQSTQNSAVTSRDFTSNSVNAPVITIAGQADVSLQLVEQSPLGSGIDQFLADDLNRDYDQQLDTQIISGTGTGGQHLGILSIASAVAPTLVQTSSFVCLSVKFFDGPTTVATQYRSIVAAVNQVETLTFSALRPTAIWAHPRRTNSWAFSAADSQNRPLFNAASYGQFNALGSAEASPVPEGVAGELFGLPVIKDANMNTTMNGTAVTGGTADPIIVLNESVPILFEGAKRFRVLPEILSGQLSMRYQLYGYSAFMPTRFPQAIAVVTGNTGLASPTF